MRFKKIDFQALRTTSPQLATVGTVGTSWWDFFMLHFMAATDYCVIGVVPCHKAMGVIWTAALWA